MGTGNAIPKKLMEQLVEDHGRNTSLWPQELQDLVNPSIEARQMYTPLSGQIKERLNREYEYFWAKDICGANPNHERVGALRYAGWDFATTKDVKMANEFTVKGESEIRNGDLVLMKIPMMKWKQMRKAQNMEAIQMAYPQAYGYDGQPMTAANLTPGMRTYMGSEADVEEMRGKARVSDPAEELATGKVSGNAAVAKIKNS
jgi:hypothetical protein